MKSFDSRIYGIRKNNRRNRYVENDDEKLNDRIGKTIKNDRSIRNNQNNIDTGFSFFLTIYKMTLTSTLLIVSVFAYYCNAFSPISNHVVLSNQKIAVNAESQSTIVRNVITSHWQMDEPQPEVCVLNLEPKEEI
jgi:hypothetical protein